MMQLVVVCLLVLLHTYDAAALSVDDNGYIMYCPCMGRFGNQADHFLGSLGFAHALNRTLVLPPWIEFNHSRREHVGCSSGLPITHPNNSIRITITVPFDKYFRVEALQKYHRVITMELFMDKLAPTIWPPGNRTVMCYLSLPGEDMGGICNAKYGNPAKPFWDAFNIDFDDSELYKPLSFITDRPFDAKPWQERFPPSRLLVMAFSGAPAAYPVRRQNVALHQYLQWSDYIEDLADSFINSNIPGRPFLGVHLRNNRDWAAVCEGAANSTREARETRGKHQQVHASAQCLGYSFEFGEFTHEICFPSKNTIMNQVKRAVERIGAVAVFVASERDAMIEDFQKALKPTVKVVRRLPGEPHVDLALLAKADHYIGNCISSFSAFAARERRSAGKSVEFWAFENKTTSSNHSDEL